MLSNSVRTLLFAFAAAMLTTGAHASDYLTEQLRCVRDAVYTEARGEPELGQLLVARAIYVRAKGDRTAMCGKVYEQSRRHGRVVSQFAGPVYHPVALQDDDPRLLQASVIAVKVALGYYVPEEKLRCITHYQNAVTADPKRSAWFKNLVPVATVGKHTFYCVQEPARMAAR